EDLPDTARVAREAPVQPAERRARGDRSAAREGGVWFRIGIGREKNADPRWILPLVCRRGDVTRDDVGKIVVLPKETRFEVARQRAEAFARAARRPDPRMPGVRVDRAEAPQEVARPRRR
ncbi:MAG TPA: DbpA RNA binding domain-containing protein, partial [Anaeromyxobacteraceae bacterium]